MKKYNKMHRLVANASIWLDSEGQIQCEPPAKNFADYVKANDSIKGYLTVHPNATLYGEWGDDKFYMVDIGIDGKLMHPHVIIASSYSYGIPAVLKAKGLYINEL